MAEKPTSRIRYDDIVNAIHSDPAKAESTVILSGYVGRSSEKGNIRIYPDAGLSQWYEVAESDVLHTEPLADSPLGGSSLWVRASAKITPSVPIPPPVEAKPEDDGKDGAATPAAVGADTGVFNPMAGIHPTLWTQFCPTGVGCIATIACLPPSIGCPPGGGAAAIHPTIWTQLCPTGVGCIATAACLPPSIGCPPGGDMMPPTIFPCTMACPRVKVNHSTYACLDRLVGQTGWHTCGCPIGPTGTQGCTQAIGCPGTSTCLAAAAQAVGPTGTQGCTQPGHCLGPTGTQGCTQPPHCLGQTGWHTCVCPIGPAQTMLGCPPTHMLGCPPTSTCPPTNHLHLCPNTHFSSCVVESFACPVTVPCPTRSPVCHPSLVAICPVSVACGIKSAEALAASPNNPTASTRCFICPPIEQAGAAAAMVGPTGTQGCTQPGHCVGQTGWFTCGCPPEVAFGTAATICTQALGCPRTSTCPPTNQVLACADTRSAICQVESAACPPPPPMTAMTQCFHCVDVWTRQPGCEPVLDPGAQINPTASTRCFICPPIGQAGGVAAAALLGPTGTQGCTQPGHCVGQTGWHTCGCPIGPTGTQGCTQICGAEMNTAATVCRPHTSDPGCPNTSTCTPQGDMPPTLVCAAAMVGPTGTQGCTQPGHCVGQTGWHTCGCPPQQSTAATLCTRYHCPIGQTGWHTCGCPVITLVTYSGCPGPSAVDACPTRLCMTIAGPCLPYTMGGCG